MRELLVGISIGFGAGISPGPLLALVISISLRQGRRAGLAVAATPLITDVPVLVLALTVLSTVSARVVAAAGLVGALVVARFAIGALRDARTAQLPGGDAEALLEAGALRRGVVVNLLSPHPWLFWLSAGGPLLVAAWRHGAFHAAGFLVGFYALLVGTKAVLATMIGSSRHRFSLAWYRRLLAFSGLLLALAAAALAVEFLPAVLR